MTNVWLRLIMSLPVYSGARHFFRYIYYWSVCPNHWCVLDIVRNHYPVWEWKYPERGAQSFTASQKESNAEINGIDMITPEVIAYLSTLVWHSTALWLNTPPDSKFYRSFSLSIIASILTMIRVELISLTLGAEGVIPGGYIVIKLKMNPSNYPAGILWMNPLGAFTILIKMYPQCVRGHPQAS